MDKTAVAKTIIRFLARGGTSAAVANIVANNRNTSDTEVVDTYHKTAAYVGGAAAGWMLGDYVATFTDAKVDETIAWFNATFKK